MKKLFIKALLLLVLVAFAILIYFIGILIINSIKDFRPKDMTFRLEADSIQSLPVSDSLFSIISWNIGYGCLGKDADFFYDGGKMVTPPHNEYRKYFDGISDALGSFDSLNLILLQEIDTFSARSYYANQYMAISKILNSYNGFYIKNYDVSFVPVPLLKPMGRVVSGLALFSAFTPGSYEQIVFPGNFPWPTSLFMPDRCFLCIRIPLASGKNLIIINTHNSAFDDGELRAGQLVLLKKYMAKLYKDGNYVVAGGDWNINPPRYQNTAFVSGDVAFKILYYFDSPKPDTSWIIVFDPHYPYYHYRLFCLFSQCESNGSSNAL
jgi:endonuclease/exonuclease/phosphatase family metal-dependent hydrolase